MNVNQKVNAKNVMVIIAEGKVIKRLWKQTIDIFKLQNIQKVVYIYLFKSVDKGSSERGVL